MIPGSNPLEEVLNTLSSINEKDVAVLAPLDSKNTDLNKIINNHIYGLLSLDELSSTQVDLLSALLRTRGY